MITDNTPASSISNLNGKNGTTLPNGAGDIAFNMRMLLQHESSLCSMAIAISELNQAVANLNVGLHELQLKLHEIYLVVHTKKGDSYGEHDF